MEFCMKNLYKLIAITALIAVIGFAVTACDDGNGSGKDPGGDPQKVTYVSTDNNGNKYTLEIDESGARSARSAARPGDTFKLTVEYTTVVGGGNLKMTFEYSGTVGAAQTSGASVSLNLNINGETITITIVGTQMTVITGRIVNDNGQEVVNNPGPVTPVDGGGNGGLTTWSAVSDSAFGTNTIYGVAYGNNTWVAVDGKGKIAYSADGRNWTAAVTNIFSYLDDVAYGAGVFVAVGGGKKAYSPDGRSWTLCSQGNDVTDNSIDYVNNMFIAAGDRGRMAYSANGINWTFVTAADVFDAGTNQNINGFAFGSNRIVGVCAGGKIGYSTDGASWTAVSNSTFGTTQINNIAYGNNRFVAVGASGKAAYSTDGVSWTAISDSAFGTSNNNIYGIAYGNNRFVAVGASGKMAYSADGLTWTAVANSAFGTTQINDVAYGSGRFVAVGASGKTAYADW